MKVLFDTNAWTRLATGDEAVLDVLGDAERIFASVFVLGELFAGFRGGKLERQNRTVLREFLSQPTVQTVFATVETAEIFGAVKNDLRRAGTPIPLNDVWIAAHALETGATLLTFDARFTKVPGVRCWPPVVR